jgi:hypothetical protein
MKTSIVSTLVILIGLGVILMPSCRDDNPEPGVPAFLHVEPFNFNADLASQGTSHQKIKDVWVFADGATIGVFELPAQIPVLKEGIGELRLEAGILLNGISTTRVNNPFFEPIVLDEFLFIPDSVFSIFPETSYRESTEFVWIESFDTPSVSLDTTNLGGEAGLVRVGEDEAYEGGFSGKFTLNSGHTSFEAATFDSYVLPVNGQPVLLEMNYKSDHFFSVGIIEESVSQIIKSEIMVLYASDEWNKIYINFTDKLRGSSASSFKVLIRSYIEDDNPEVSIWLDNLKLMYR